MNTPTRGGDCAVEPQESAVSAPRNNGLPPALAFAPTPHQPGRKGQATKLWHTKLHDENLGDVLGTWKSKKQCEAQ
jgi:hypothetical protein